MVPGLIGESDTPKPNGLWARDELYDDGLALWHDCGDSEVIDATGSVCIDFDKVEHITERVVQQWNSVFVFEIETGGNVAGAAGKAKYCRKLAKATECFEKRTPHPTHARTSFNEAVALRLTGCRNSPRQFLMVLRIGPQGVGVVEGVSKAKISIGTQSTMSMPRRDRI